MFMSKLFEVKAQFFFDVTSNLIPIQRFHHDPSASYTALPLSSLQNSGNRLRDTFPVGALSLELFSPRARQFVEFGPAIILGNVPGGGNPTAFFHPIECRV